jgi:hypothetical protein
VVGVSAVEAEWRRLLGEELPHIRSAGLLRRSGTLARAYPREPGSAFSLLPYQVVEHGHDDYVGVCPDGWGNVLLTREQLLLWELDVRRLATEVAAALSVTAAFEADVLPFTSRLGSYAAGGTLVPVYVTLSLGRSTLTAVARALAVMYEPCVLLAPTRRLLGEDCGRVIRMRRMCFAALDELLQLGRDNRLIAVRPLGQLLTEQRCVQVDRSGETADQQCKYYSPGEQADLLGVDKAVPQSSRYKRAAAFRTAARGALLKMRPRPTGAGTGKGEYVRAEDFDAVLRLVRAKGGERPVERFMGMWLGPRWRCADPNCGNITESPRRPPKCPKCERAKVVRDMARP